MQQQNPEGSKQQHRSARWANLHLEARPHLSLVKDFAVVSERVSSKRRQSNIGAYDNAAANAARKNPRSGTKSKRLLKSITRRAIENGSYKKCTSRDIEVSNPQSTTADERKPFWLVCLTASRRPRIHAKLRRKNPTLVFPRTRRQQCTLAASVPFQLVLALFFRLSLPVLSHYFSSTSSFRVFNVYQQRGGSISET